MVLVDDMTPGEMAAIKAHLPELMVMARARHADVLVNKGIDIDFCGTAKNWEACCTITDMGNYTQAMLWYNVKKDTHGVALEIKC